MKPEVYEGNEKFIFISYAHKDSDTVLSIANEISRAGYRIWYDDGIAAGSEWPETIAQHLDRAAAFIAFISPNSVVSDNCRNEINFAISRKKTFLSVFIEDTEVPLGIELQIAAKQGVIRSKCRNRDEFISKIINSEIIAGCKQTDEETENTDLSTDAQEASENRNDAGASAKSGSDFIGHIRTNYKKYAAVCIAAMLLIVAVAVLNNLNSYKSSIPEGLMESVSKGSEIVVELIRSVDPNSLSTGGESESKTGGGYKFDYPTFSGREITVTDIKELENALRDAANGDTIIIRSGEYESDKSLFVDKKVRICGEGDTKPVIHNSLRVRTGGVLIENIEINITDPSKTYDSEYREDRYTCIETDDTDPPTYIRDVVLKSNASCAGVWAYGDIVMENSYIDTVGEAIFLTAKAKLNGNTLKSSYRGILIWGLYGIRDNPEEIVEEFRKNNTIVAPLDIESKEE